MQFQLECEREDDGRWLAESAAISGVLAYGASANEAMSKTGVLALRVLAKQLELGEAKQYQHLPASGCMNQWPSAKAKRVFNALLGTGWQLERQSGSHRPLAREGWPNFVFAFHDGKELGSCSDNADRVWQDEDHPGRSIRLAGLQSETGRGARIPDLRRPGDDAHRSQHHPAKARRHLDRLG